MFVCFIAKQILIITLKTPIKKLLKDPKYFVRPRDQLFLGKLEYLKIVLPE
jgi:hypothetical protein